MGGQGHLVRAHQRRGHHHRSRSKYTRQEKKRSVLAYSASRARAAEFPLRLLLSLVQFLASPLTIHIP